MKPLYWTRIQVSAKPEPVDFLSPNEKFVLLFMYSIVWILYVQMECV